MVDCTNRSVAVFTSPTVVIVLGEEEVIDGGEAVPGFVSWVGDFFVDLDIGQPV